ncbi:abortive infection protein [Microlunatus speluncae]|uniref:abortive infection protein n=1 Tax=Microlunatus speluncae TaxID=2594267 RepID=UPI0012666001|nr:abortive infection protein [Microlunatus speluncae]
MTAPPIRGIGYDVGVVYERDQPSRPHWRAEDVRRDLRVIADELACNAVMIMGSDNDQLAEAGAVARELGLFAWLQPRLFDHDPDEVLDHLGRAAELAEELRRQHGDVGLNVGCELSLSVNGFVPGRTFIRRGSLLPWFFWLKPVYDRRLNRFLERAVTLARARFAGPLSYGSGPWESVDWRRFDYIGLDYYLDASNRWRFAGDVRRHVRTGRPVLITEFGCCTYQGAAERGAGGFSVIDYGTDPPTMPAQLVRSERVQADYLDESLDIFTEAGVHGTFVFGFSEPSLPTSADPIHDLDQGSFGIVKVLPPGDRPEGERWQRKEAFGTLARRYGAAAATATTAEERS